VSLLGSIANLFGLAGIAGLSYQFASALAVRQFMARPAPTPKARPPVTVLKPLCGAEPGLEAHLTALLRQGYPDLQVVCGVADPTDPAIAVVHRVMDQFPQADVSLVVDPTVHGNNLKIGNLINMMRAVRHDLLVIADSDVAPHDGYLDQAVQPFADPEVGLVTFLYVGKPLPDVVSRLGAVGINHGFLPSALVARWLGREDGCFGATICLPTALLRRMGGFEAVADKLADDWELGAMVRRQGLKIAIAARPVALTVAERDLQSLFDHEVRWGRTIAAVDRASYMASVITQPVPLTLLAAATGGWRWLPLLAVALIARALVVRLQERALGLPNGSVADLLLRDLLSFVVFVTACCGKTVLWRGKRFKVASDGKLTLLEG
jgi:ceramide glucosyltransferase